jgi:hypothetical protein
LQLGTQEDKTMKNEINDMSEADYKEDDDEFGFDKEDFGEEIITKEKPFDPRKVDVSITTPNLGALIERLRHNEIKLIPDFQRSGDLWSPQAQSRLIESILIRLPIPAFYFDALDENEWQVVDGLQRLSAIKSFVLDKTLSLTNLEFLPEQETHNYDQLPRALQRRIEEFQTSVYLIKPGTPAEVKYSLFHRINTGGLKLNNQEIRHAMCQSVNNGAASTFLSDIVLEDAFLKLITGKNNRMAHQELVLRHMAFILFGSVTYKSSLPKFLDNAMNDLGFLDNNAKNNLRDNFLAAMKTAYDIFGNDAFKKTLLVLGHKKVVNKPLFEAVSVQLALLTPNERSLLTSHRSSFKDDFKRLLSDDIFNNSISLTTANTYNVQTRFKMVEKIMSDYVLRSL